MTRKSTPVACELRSTDQAPGFAQADLAVPDPGTPAPLELLTQPAASHPRIVGGQPKGMWCSGCRRWVYRDASDAWPRECPGCARGANGGTP